MSGKKGFRSVGASGPINAVPYKYWEEDEFPVSVAGILKKVSTDKFKKPNYHITLSEDIHIVTNDEKRTKGKNKGKGFEDLVLKAGEVIVLNAAGTLDPKMEEIDEGQEILVELEGMEEITDETHDYCGDMFYVFNVYAKDDSAEEEEVVEEKPAKRSRRSM